MIVRILVILLLVITCSEYGSKVKGNHIINYISSDQSVLQGVILAKESMKPIKHAILILNNSDTIRVSDEGMFQFDLSEGYYTVSVKAVGHRQYKVSNLILKPKTITNLEVQLGTDIIY